MKNKFLLGCCYYPEHWNKNNIEYDIGRIKDLGFNVVRMGEFSWSSFEREEGKYDFSLLSEAVSIAKDAGLDVILGTPTAAPPVWLTEKYPEVLCADEKRNVMQHGSRQHHNHTSKTYIHFCEKITEAMVKHFCKFDNVIGWQIDNEFNCHRNESYSEADDKAFGEWLEKKYKTVENLNAAWGAAFWSLEYNNFSQVKCPGAMPCYKNPSMMTDYYLFLSDTVVDYAYAQTKIIRKYMPDAFITHNGIFENIDYKKLTDKCLDILGFDCYPAFPEKREIGLGRKKAYHLARTRGYSEKFLIPEQQAGPGGQLSYLLPTPLPGQLRLWTYQSIAHGAVGIIYFRYRTALFGAEQLWYGIYGHDGEENLRTAEIRETAKEINRLGDIFLNERQSNKVAIFNDYHNNCANKAEPYFKDDSSKIFETLNNKNIQADFVYSYDDIGKYKIVIFPHIAIADEKAAEAVERFTANGGIAVISSRSGVKDENSHYRPIKAPGVFRNAAGCRVEWFSSVPDHSPQNIRFGDKTYPVSLYYEMLESEGGEPVGCYTDGFCKDKPAIVKNKNVYYIGAYCDTEIYADIIEKHIDISKPIEKHLEEVAIGKYKMYLNHGDTHVKLCGNDLLKQESFEEIPPYGVVLVEL